MVRIIQWFEWFGPSPIEPFNSGPRRAGGLLPLHPARRGRAGGGRGVPRRRRVVPGGLVDRHRVPSRRPRGVLDHGGDAQRELGVAASGVYVAGEVSREVPSQTCFSFS